MFVELIRGEYYENKYLFAYLSGAEKQCKKLPFPRCCRKKPFFTEK